MNADLGLIGVALSLIAAVSGVATIGVGLATGRASVFRHARTFALWVLAGAVLSTIGMERAFLEHDFSIAFVAANNSRETPLLYSITGMWSALQGSILLWALILAGYLAAMTHWFRKRASDPLVAWASLIGLCVAVFFFALIAGPANPFAAVAGHVPADGAGPNPLLQDNPLVAFHPVFLYLGFVGFTVPFSFAIATLVTGRVERGLAARDPPLDAVRMGFPDDRHRAGGMVVLPGPRLGRFLGLGPGRERRPPALALRHCVSALGDGPRAARAAASLEPVASDRDVLTHDPRDVSHPFGRARVGALLLGLDDRPGASGVLRPRRRRSESG